MITVAEAAVRIGCAHSTVLGMIQRGELSAMRDGSGKLWLHEDEVDRAPRRGRGHPKVAAEKLKGARYAKAVAKGLTPSQVAAKVGVTRQDVSHEIARYNAARKAEETAGRKKRAK